MKKRFTILAPDTDCGKTFITAMLLRKATGENINAMACKPIQTGSLNGKSQDLDFILNTANLKISPEIYSTLVLCTLKTPASALLAGKIEKRKINLDEIVKKILEVSQNYDTFFVETAGGIYSPVTETLNNIDMAKKLGFPAIICIPNRTGAISLSVMTVKILIAEGIEIGGAAFTQTIKPKNEIEETICSDNVETFEKITGVKVIADIKFIKEK